MENGLDLMGLDLVNDVLQNKIRDKLVQMRIQSGLSMEELALELDTDVELLNSIENGEDDVSVDLLVKFISFYTELSED